MPIYPVKCGCGWSGEKFAHMADRYKITCDRCGDTRLETDMEHMTVPGIKREWQDGENVSLAMRFDPSALSDLRKDVPDLELHDDGCVKFRSDAHQRRVYRQMDAALKRNQERAAEAPAAKENSGVQLHD